MVGKLPVKSRIVLTQPIFGDSHYLDVTSTFNMTQRVYLDRDPDMLVENEDGERIRINKALVAAIKEIRVIGQEVEEVGVEQAVPDEKAS